MIAAIIILCREILVSGLREFLAELQVSVPVTKLAKWKTTVQLIAVAFLLAGPAGDTVFAYTTQTGLVALWLAACLPYSTGTIIPGRHRPSDNGIGAFIPALTAHHLEVS